jgi:hypothetical protein
MKCVGCDIETIDNELFCDSCYERFMRHQEGVDICSVCGEVFPYGTLDEINEIEFDLICEKCKENNHGKKNY